MFSVMPLRYCGDSQISCGTCANRPEASLAYKLSKRFTLQGGAFFSPAGQNALDERGLVASLWANF